MYLKLFIALSAWVCPSLRDRVSNHAHSTEGLEHLGSQNLGEDVSQIVSLRDMLRSHDFPVAEGANPLLSAVNVFELCFLSRTLAENLGSLVVHLEDKGRREVQPHLIDHV